MFFAMLVIIIIVIMAFVFLVHRLLWRGRLLGGYSFFNHLVKFATV